MNEQQIYATPLSRTTATSSASLSQQAIDALRHAANVPMEERTYFREERNVWRPDSWLLSRCRERLAQVGSAQAAVQVAQLAQDRDPLAIAKTAHELAASGQEGLYVEPEIYQALAHREHFLFSPIASESATLAMQELLLSTATYARLGNRTALFTYLERLDQLPGAWERLLVDAEQRGSLAEILARGGRHPLTAALIASATRRYDDAGADLLHRVTTLLDVDDPQDRQMIERCAAAVRYASLTTLHSQRVAVSILARAGHSDEVMRHLTTIDNIQEARRESGLALRRNEQQLLRQVKRPQANADIDFQVYTLQEALRVMPLRRIGREQRAAMAKQLAVLGMRSDGWTAAGAATTLVELGALKLAIEVVDKIEPTDPTRGEGAIALVRGLLAVDEPELAAEQTRKALAWIRTFGSENAERATIWGLVEVYLDHRRPQEALSLLDQRVRQANFGAQIRGIFQSRFTDDNLRNRRYRLRAHLQQNRPGAEIKSLTGELRNWAPKLLDGDALAAFLIDGLLAPLLSAGYVDMSLALLPDIQKVLATGSGDRHAAHLQRFSTLWKAEVPALSDEARAQLEGFLVAQWSSDRMRGIWQAVHGIEGSLLLIEALAGANALVDIARVAVAEGGDWLPPMPTSAVQAEARRASHVAAV